MCGNRVDVAVVNDVMMMERMEIVIMNKMKENRGINE